MMEQHKTDTNTIRFIAILLITNSHLDSLYPVPLLATGGSIGNALFFMLSGYGLMQSETNNQRTFWQWYGRRAMRIYPSLIVTVAILHLWLGKGWKSWTWFDYLKGFVWPTPAWFISAMMVFYIIFFIIMKLRKSAAFLLSIAALTVPYLYLYATRMDLSHYSIEGPGYFKWIFYLQVMLFGGFLGNTKTAELKDKSHRPVVLLFFALFGYFALLLVISKGYGSQYQAIVHLLTLPIIYLVFMIFRSSSVIQTKNGNRVIAYVIGFVSGLTLEIYLLQNFVYSSRFVQSLSFPVNTIVFWLAVLLLSFLLAKASGLIRRFLPQNR